MVIKLSRAEFAALRQCVIDAQAEPITNGFNAIFSGKIPEITVTTVDTHKELDIDPELAIEIIEVISKHSQSTGKTVMGFVRAAPTTVLTGLGIFKDLKTLINRRRSK
ncbi:MAG: hypothetical protein NC548_05615 [Lachnospiraceae bacterium]|nr:hypothetical protein [Lachnospiraceae bacterium]